jgi:hypothetical protein
MLIEQGIPTICGFGPNGGAPHAPNGTLSHTHTLALAQHTHAQASHRSLDCESTEWVEVASLGTTVDIYCDIVHRYLGLD